MTDDNPFLFKLDWDLPTSALALEKARKIIDNEEGAKQLVELGMIWATMAQRLDHFMEPDYSALGFRDDAMLAISEVIAISAKQSLEAHDISKHPEMLIYCGIQVGLRAAERVLHRE